MRLSIRLIIRSGLNDTPPAVSSWRSVAGDGAAAATGRGSSAGPPIASADAPGAATPALVDAVRAIAVAMRPAFTEWSGSGPAAGAERSVDATAAAGTR